MYIYIDVYVYTHVYIYIYVYINTYTCSSDRPQAPRDAVDEHPEVVELRHHADLYYIIVHYIIV